MALACALLCAAPASAKADLHDPNIVEEWAQPADIAFVGDSESLGYFGDGLYRAMTSERDPKTGRKLTVWSYWTCGSDVQDWVSGGRTYCGTRSCNRDGQCARDHGGGNKPGRVRYAALRDYLAEVKPRLTVVSLGSNMLSWGPRDFNGGYQTYLANAARLVGEIAARGSACVWIGPPQVSDKTKPVSTYEKFVADVGKAVRAKGCAFIDSNPLSDRRFIEPGDSEGIHYKPTGEKNWQAKVWQQLRPLLTARLSR